MFDPEDVRLARSFGLPREDWWTKKTEAAVANLRRLVPRALEAGVKICLGTDSNPGLLWREAGHLYDLGATSSQALRAVTKNGAELLGLADQVGALRPGMAADLVALDEDPLANPWALERARLITQSGRMLVGSRP